MSRNWASPGNCDDAVDALHAGLTVELIATPRDDLKTCRLDERASDVSAHNEDLFDFLPVLPSGGSDIIGLFAATHPEHTAGTESVADYVIPLTEHTIIGADASILDFITEADRKPCRLVVSGNHIVGLVSLSDLQKLPVRAALFALITGLEITMIDTIKRQVARDTWLDDLSFGRQASLAELINATRKENVFVDDLLFTQFCDKWQILLKRFKLSGRKTVRKQKFKNIQRLRDHLAHANEYASSREQAQQVCATVRDILELRRELSELLP